MHQVHLQCLIIPCLTNCSLFFAYISGPWLTFEIQLPQDDFNLLAWVLGKEIPTAELDKSKHDYQLRGLSSEEQLLRGSCSHSWEGLALANGPAKAV